MQVLRRFTGVSYANMKIGLTFLLKKHLVNTISSMIFFRTQSQTTRRRKSATIKV